MKKMYFETTYISGFILTMRNVNLFNVECDELQKLGFILTMRNVNVIKMTVSVIVRHGFILTMRNVNS
ncbi:MAG: hypothetical protein ACRCYH_09275 [Clostridium chrysemydis]